MTTSVHTALPEELCPALRLAADGLPSVCISARSSVPRAGIARAKRIAIALVLLPAFCLASVADASEPADQPVAEPSEEVDFNRHIRPLFNEHCTACHGGVKQAGDLSFVYRDSALNVIEPGDAESSYILERVISDDESERMPPPEHGPGLNDDEVQLLRRWINEGAKWGKHWAFIAPKRQNAPAVQQTDWPRTPIDAFVLARIEKGGLTVNPQTTPARWLRRASLDATGLPPSPEQIKQFEASVAADGEAAYQAAVHRLLSTPNYGEKWASPWLDAVRYADSRGLGLDGRRNIWKYRDWVIDSLNRDMPFNGFTVKQLAGDLLEDATLDDLVATACHRLTQTNEEGGTDDEQFRVEAVIDRVNTTWQTWQGVSFGCVQCHSHPYDPIQHEEYYEFLSYFNNTTDSDLSNDAPTIPVPIRPSDYARSLELYDEIREIQQTLFDRAEQITSDQVWGPMGKLSASTNNTTQVVVADVDGVTEVQTRGTVAKSTTVIVETHGFGEQQLTAVRVTGLPRDSKAALRDSEWGFVISAAKLELLDKDGQPQPVKFSRVIGDEPHPILDPNDSLNPKNSNGVGPYTRMHHARSAVFVLESPLTVAAGEELRISLSQNIFALGAFPLVAPRLRLAYSDDAAWQTWASDSAWTRLAAARREQKKIPSVNTPVMQRRADRFLRPTGVFSRGNYLTKDGVVKPDTPEFLAGNPGESRLAMAKWIASETNPLSARVQVNRVWSAIFGVGIVATQEDFGSTGDAPSHPMLLDDLAVRFQTEMNWSQKTLIREILLSSTYRQSAVSTPEQRKLDPQNRLLSRGPRRRLTAEEVRDQALLISGLLVDKQFGQPVYPPIPSGVWNPFQAGDKWKTAEKGNPDRYRRTIYTYTKRSIQFPIMASFDAPTRESCSMRRLPSNTPLQALMTLNDEAFVECAQAFAERMIASADKPEAQISFGYRAATGRIASPAALAMLLELYNSQVQTPGDQGDGEIDQQQALTPVALVLLNLDEVLNN